MYLSKEYSALDVIKRMHKFSSLCFLRPELKAHICFAVWQALILP